MISFSDIQRITPTHGFVETQNLASPCAPPGIVSLHPSSASPWFRMEGCQPAPSVPSVLSVPSV